MDLGLAGRTAIVCASTSGLGEATARALAAEGARVVVSGRRAERAAEIAAELPEAVGVGVDLTAPDGPETPRRRGHRGVRRRSTSSCSTAAARPRAPPRR